MFMNKYFLMAFLVALSLGIILYFIDGNSIIKSIFSMTEFIIIALLLKKGFDIQNIEKGD